MTEPKLSAQHSPIRTVAVVVTGLFLLLVSIWGASLLYWHWRLRAAVREWEWSFSAELNFHDLVALRAKPDVLHEAGCRALPYLVESLNTSANAKLQRNAMVRILDTLSKSRRSDADSRWILEEWREWASRDTRDASFNKGARIAEFNRWWMENGPRYHQWWRTWSAWCAGAQP